MKRTQIYLDEEESAILSLLSTIEKKTMSELIRDAIDRTYLHGKRVDFSQALHIVSGIWQDRNDIVNTDDYLRKLRIDRRSDICEKED